MIKNSRWSDKNLGRVYAEKKNRQIDRSFDFFPKDCLYIFFLLRPFPLRNCTFPLRVTIFHPLFFILKIEGGKTWQVRGTYIQLRKGNVRNRKKIGTIFWEKIIRPKKLNPKTTKPILKILLHYLIKF